MRSKAELQEEISQIRQQIEAITVGDVPVEGYEAEYQDLQQRLTALQEQWEAMEPEPEDDSPNSVDEAPLLARWLEEAKGLTEEEQFAEALIALDEAERYVGDFRDRQALVAKTRRQVRQVRETWKKGRAERIEQALQDEAQPLPKEIETWIEEYWAKAPDEESQVQTWLERVAGHRRLDAAAQAAETLRRELEPLRAECEQAIARQEIVAAAEAAREALSRVRELKREYPEAGPVLALEGEAEGWDKRARGPAATAATTANFEELLEEYEELRERGHKELPRFRVVREAGRLRFTPDDRGQDILQLESGWETELAPAENAIQEIETLATEYACQKAEEKLELARQTIPEDPRRAAVLLKEAQDLFVPELRKQDKQWLAWLGRLDEYDHIIVRPAVARREGAERRRDTALTLPDVLAAWGELGKVEESDPHTPLLDQARAGLHDRLVFRIEEALKHAHGLRRRRRWEEAQQAVEPFLARTRQDQNLANWSQRLEEFIQGCEEGARDEKSTLQTLAEIQGLVEGGKVQEADERLIVLEKQLGEDVTAYPQAGRLRDRIDGRLKLQSLLDRVTLTHNAATSDEELQPALNALEEALEEHKAHPQVLALQKRLRARLLFRRAEREYGIAPFADVRARYQSVIDLGGDDADQAQQRLEQMAKDEKEARKIEQILTTAQDHLDNERYRQACKLLEPWTERVIPQSGHVHELFEAATEGLIEKIERELEVLRRRGKRRLDTRSIFEQVDELTGLDSERARRWNELQARCYMQLAQEAASVDDALRHWQKAHGLVSPESRWYPAIAAGLRQADKERVFGQVGALLVASERAPRLEELRKRYQDDPEIHLHLTDTYLQMGDLQAARAYFGSTQRLLSQAAADVAAGLPELTQVQERLEREERLQREKERIQTCLQPENSLGDFQWAVRRRNLLLKKEPLCQRVLDDWWETLVDRVVGELEAEWEEEQERDTPLWKAAWPMLKILELRKEHGRARGILRDVARRSLDLRGKVDKVLHQTTGPAGVPAEDALSRQIHEADELLAEAQAYQEVFQRRGGELRKLRPTDLDDSVQRLRGWWETLTGVQARIEEARGHLREAMRTGEQRQWNQVESLIQQITGTIDRSAPGAEPSRHVSPTDVATFAAHPAVRLLVQDFKEAKETRERLEQYVRELPEAWKREDFARARWLIEQLRQEDQEGQKYGLSNRRIRIEVLEAVDTNLDQLERLLSEREGQLSQLRGWAEAVWQVIPWQVLPPRYVETSLERGTPEVIRALDAIHRAVQSGDFRRAGGLYAALPVLADGSGADKDGPPVQPLVELVEEAIRKREAFVEAFEYCLEALCGDTLPIEIRNALKEEWPNFRQVIERWNAVRESQEGGRVSILAYGGKEMWSLLKAKQWLEKPPLGSDGSVLSWRAGLVVAQAMALAGKIDAWVTEAQGQLEAIPETQERFNELLQRADASMNHAATLRRWWQKRERQRFLQGAREALDEAGEFCQGKVHAERRNLLNGMWK